MAFKLKNPFVSVNPIKVGDIVLIKKDIEKFSKSSDGIFFTPEMQKMCGKSAIIGKILLFTDNSIAYKLTNDEQYFLWSADWFVKIARNIEEELE